MGYYIRFGCDAVVPPLVVVIRVDADRSVSIQKKRRTVGKLPKIDLWKAGPEIDEKVLWLLCLFVCPDHYVERTYHCLKNRKQCQKET